MRILVEETSPTLPLDSSRRLSQERVRVPWPVRLLPIIVLIAAFFAQIVAARGAPATGAPVRPSDMRAGSLLIQRDDEGAYVEAPRLGTDVAITVSGPTARARVTQLFHNPTDRWVEAV